MRRQNNAFAGKAIKARRSQPGQHICPCGTGKTDIAEAKVVRQNEHNVRLRPSERNKRYGGCSYRNGYNSKKLFHIVLPLFYHKTTFDSTSKATFVAVGMVSEA